MEESINHILSLLNDNEEWKGRYEKYLKEIYENWVKKDKGFHKPEGLSVYCTFADRNTLTYFLRFKGQNVAKVTKKDGKIVLECINCDKIKGCPNFNGSVDWKSSEASKLRSFFKNLPSETETKSPEHYVESSILKEFRKKNGDEKIIRYIQPVLLQGQFFQMPTPLACSNHKSDSVYRRQNGGGIDILARIRNSEGRLRLCVMEVKDENTNKESQADAMSQAVEYATFIAKLLSEQREWWEFFMGHHKKRESLPNTLDKSDIDVVTIMPEGSSKEIIDASIPIPETGITLHCYSLYYDNDIFKKDGKFKFSGSFLNEVKK